MASPRRSRDIDGGYGWVIMVASTALQVVWACSFATFGPLFLPFLDHFQASKTITAWIGAFKFGSMGIAGIAIGPLVKLVGCRWPVIISSCLISIGYTCSAFVDSIGLMYLTYGLIPGLAYGSYMVCAPVAVQQYFDKRRSFALGVTMAGVSLGIFLWAPLAAFLITSYGWQGAVLIHGAIQLHGVVIGLLLRPPPPSLGMELDISVGASENQEASSCNIHMDGHLKPDFAALNGDGKDVVEHQTEEISSTLLRKTPIPVPNQTVNDCDKATKNTLMLPTERELGHTPDDSPTNSVAFEEGTSSSSNSNSVFCRSLTDVVKLLKNAQFLLYCIGILIHKMGHFLVFTFLPVRGAYVGAAPEAASLLVSIVGTCSCTCRVPFGILADKLGEKRVYWNGVSASVAGLLTTLSIFCTGYTSLAVYAASYGIIAAVFILLEVSCIVDLWGREALAKGTGILMAVIGLCNLIGTPLTGVLMDLTGDPAMPFLVLGSCQILGGILSLTATILQRKINTRGTIKVPQLH